MLNNEIQKEKNTKWKEKRWGKCKKKKKKLKKKN
jgi:hypothetical protein